MIFDALGRLALGEIPAEEGGASASPSASESISTSASPSASSSLSESASLSLSESYGLSRNNSKHTLVRNKGK